MEKKGSPGNAFFARLKKCLIYILLVVFLQSLTGHRPVMETGLMDAHGGVLS
jgi:hypothetical protein